MQACSIKNCCTNLYQINCHHSSITPMSIRCRTVDVHSVMSHVSSSFPNWLVRVYICLYSTSPKAEHLDSNLNLILPELLSIATSHKALQFHHLCDQLCAQTMFLGAAFTHIKKPHTNREQSANFIQPSDCLIFVYLFEMTRSLTRVTRQLRTVLMQSKLPPRRTVITTGVFDHRVLNGWQIGISDTE